MTTPQTLIHDWPSLLREDGRRVEILCPHGIGHPSQKLSRGWQKHDGVHGCDGCCWKVVFYLAEMAHLEAADQTTTP